MVVNKKFLEPSRVCDHGVLVQNFSLNALTEGLVAIIFSFNATDFVVLLLA